MNNAANQTKWTRYWALLIMAQLLIFIVPLRSQEPSLLKTEVKHELKYNAVNNQDTQIASSSLNAVQNSRVKGAYSAQAASFALSISTPMKIFTPNNDGYNDSLVLSFDNPKLSIINEAKIYDLTGAEVGSLSEITQPGTDPTRLSWDGRDSNGSLVRTGIYIYQVQSEGELVNGTVVVAR